MKWYNLKRNHCPKCGREVEPNGSAVTPMIVCSSSGCDFKIAPRRMTEIVESLVSRDLEEMQQERVSFEERYGN